MAKEKTHLAIVTKNGVPEAIFLGFLEKNPKFKKEWMTRSEKHYIVLNFEEMTEKEIERETEKYAIYYEKEKERRKKEFNSSRDEVSKKIVAKENPEELPSKDVAKKPEESESEEKKEEITEKKPRKRTIIKTRRK